MLGVSALCKEDSLKPPPIRAPLSPTPLVTPPPAVRRLPWPEDRGEGDGVGWTSSATSSGGSSLPNSSRTRSMMRSPAAFPTVSIPPIFLISRHQRGTLGDGGGEGGGDLGRGMDPLSIVNQKDPTPRVFGPAIGCQKRLQTPKSKEAPSRRCEL